MAWPTAITPVALTANEFLPIDLGNYGAKNVILQCRTAVDVYLATTPSAGTAYYTLKSGTSVQFTFDDIYSPSSVSSDMVQNGTFTGSASGWTLGTGWAYSANTVVKNADGTGTLSQTITFLENGIYKLVYTISGWSVGTVTPSIGGTSGIARGADGTYTEYIKAGASGDLLFTPTNTSRFTIDTISVVRYALKNGIYAKAQTGTPTIEAWIW